MSTATPYPTRLEFSGELRIARWRPLVQWLLAIPQLAVANALGTLRHVLTVVALFTVLFTRRIPRPLFDAIAMTLRYEWRVISYALFLRKEYPPFDFQPSAEDDGVDPHTLVAFTYMEQMSRWQPLYKWLLAIPHYLVLLFLAIAAVFVVLGGFIVVLVTGRYPAAMRDFLVDTYRYGLRVEAYVGLLTDDYPPFTLKAA
jgi:roadblock/LC7 domain-containing protein